MRRKINRIAVTTAAAACVVMGSAAIASATGPMVRVAVYSGSTAAINDASCVAAGIAFQVTSGGRHWECDASQVWANAYELWEEQ